MNYVIVGTLERHPKPPYSYSSIIMLALLTEETRQLPLRKIIERLVSLEYTPFN